ncbi:auxin-responsive protein IAA28-like [Papaver somniferum]|nr:auxin-responsive protein IAA28-like [Papaver somniferum]
MKNQFIEATAKQEKEEKDGELNHILGPKTKETELRLGFVGSDSIPIKATEEKIISTKRLITSPSDQQTLLVNGAGYGTTKRWCSDHDHLTTQGGFAKNNPWSNNSSSDPKKEKADFQSRPLPTRVPPVVGWPPVRAFRRNLTSPSKQEMKTKDAASTKIVFATDDEVMRKSTAMDTMYVKVNMEGYAVGRKINLKAHESYESLSQALQNMFDNFLSSVNFSKNGGKAQDGNPPEEVQGSKHVLLYEDNEGDRILVGDVPWEMFTSTAKRLFIISGSKAPAIVAGGEV